MRTFLFSLGCLFLSLTGYAQLTAKSVKVKGNATGFYEFKPEGYNENKNRKYPLIIFLHGIGERGNGTSELPAVLYHGLPRYLKQGAKMTYTVNGQTESFLVLIPQLPKWMGYWDYAYVDAMLEYAEEELQVDKDRIFLTGLSLGGGGVWGYASSSLKNAKKFAAIAPVCGVCYYDLKALPETIGKADIGVWGFANMDDNIVSPWCTISAVDAIKKVNPKKVKSTILNWGGHDAWTKAYDPGHRYQKPNMYEWFLEMGQKGSGGGSGGGSGDSQFPINAAPVAKAGNDISITLPDDEVTLSNAGSYDSDGSIASWTWSTVSGPSQPTFTNANSSSTNIKSLVAGTYVFRLTIKDNDGATAYDDVAVTVNRAPNKKPVAKAGDDLTITLPANKVTLRNSGSYDPDGDIKKWQWNQVSGPSTADINSPNANNTEVEKLVAGTYVFKLTVSDDDGASDEDQVSVVVNRAPNVKPVAKAGDDINITLPTNKVTLKNAGSYDADGDIKGWKWSQVSGPAVADINSPNANYTEVEKLVAGTYVFKLTVSDDDGASDEDQVSVVVNRAPNVKPVAKAGDDITITLPTNNVTLKNAGSYDSDGNIKGWKWSQVSGPSDADINSPNANNTEVQKLVAGTYVFKLTVSDDDGAADEDVVSVVVNRAPNVKPVAKAGDDITITLPTNNVSLRNAGSYDADGNIKNWKWSQVSGPSTADISAPNANNTEVEKLVAGTYVFKLTVSDDDGASDEDVVSVVVNRAPNVKPTAKAGDDITITLPANKVTLKNSGSWDPDGNIKGWKWSQVSGPSAADLNSPNANNTDAEKLVAGTYVFRLTVTDEDGATDVDDVKVEVNRAANIKPTAKAGEDITITLPADKVILKNSGSWDPDGYIKGWLWTQVSGPANADINSPNSNNTEIEKLVAGTYVFKLTVYDYDGASAEDEVRVVVNRAANIKPVAKAGDDISITLPVNKVTLRNSGSWDSEGYIKGWKWSQVSGPSVADINSPNANNTEVEKLVAGTYTFSLEVTDEDGATDVDELSVIVNAPIARKPPVANAGKDETIPVGQATVLHGEDSYAQGGKIVDYVWTKVAGPDKYEIFTPNYFATWIRYMDPGTYVYRLTVTDDNGLTDFDDVTITVKAPQSAPPVAEAGKDFNIWLPYSGLLDGTGSKAAPGSTLVKYNWSKISGPDQYNMVSPHLNGSWINSLVPGIYTFRLTVTDNNGLSSSDDVVVTVRHASTMSNSGNNQGVVAEEPGSSNLPGAATNKLNIYPNPVVSSLNLKWTGDIKGAATINIVNTDGQTVKTIKMRKEQTDYYTSIDVSSLVPGTYFIQIQSQNGKPLHQQFLKR